MDDVRNAHYEAKKRCCTVCDSKQKCTICGNQTDLACSDCRIDFQTTIFVCRESACRDKHEQKCSARLRERLDAPAAPQEPEREKNRIRSMAWAFYQVLGAFYGIKGPARIMNWFYDVAHGEDRETSELFPITPEERAKYEWKELDAPDGRFGELDIPKLSRHVYHVHMFIPKVNDLSSCRECGSAYEHQFHWREGETGPKAIERILTAALASPRPASQQEEKS